MSILKIKTYYPETLVKGIHSLSINFFDKGFEIFHLHSAFAVPTKYFDIREFTGLKIKRLEVCTHISYEYRHTENCKTFRFFHTNTTFTWEKTIFYFNMNMKLQMNF